jgi:hypothetical protein
MKEGEEILLIGTLMRVRHENSPASLALLVVPSDRDTVLRLVQVVPA